MLRIDFCHPVDPFHSLDNLKSLLQSLYRSSRAELTAGAEM